MAAKFKSIITACLASLVSLALFTTGLAPAQAAIMDWTAEQHLLNQVWQLVNRSYYDPSFNGQNWYKIRKKFSNIHPENREQTYDLIDQMLATLDEPFTRLLRPEQYASMTTSTAGSLTGVGLQITIDPQLQSLVVITPIEGSPAELAGVRSLDRIIAIDQIPTTGMTLDECAEKLRGEINTPVILSILRPLVPTEVPPWEAPQITENRSPIQTLEHLNIPFETLEIEVIRGQVLVNPITAKLNQYDQGKIGYIRLSQFNGNAAAAMAQVIQQFESAGAQGYVLDLRGNPGGLLQAGVEIAREWLDQGAIVYTVDRQGIQETYRATGASLTQKPLVVLTDGGSASASEVLAGALHDNDRAQLVGTRTYGKGLVQSLFELEDGAGLAVTIAKYETPNHTDIHKVGIKPDLEVKLTHNLSRPELGTEQDEQYMAALQLLTDQNS
ncbi:MAG: S41 family peptidase [Pseudanabaenaceae cyanobacterium bins.68]|nr:S41 family peptidase [Pseudanabaenaceae cyanobacterium bins.68]